MVRYFLSRERTGHSLAPDLTRFAARAVMSACLATVFVWLLAQRLTGINWADVHAAIAAVGGLHWLAAIVATALSFWAVGQYDAVLHRHFATGLPVAQTRRAGICAIAVGQTVGFGLISGALMRWRMVPGQSLLAATKFTAAVAVSFLAGWAVITAVVLVMLPQAPVKWAGYTVLLAAVALFSFAMVARPVRMRLPNSFAVLQLLGLCAVDTFAAAVAFYILCPAGVDLTFAQILPAFLLALGAGLISGTPGGVGAFELALLAMLPGQPTAPLLAAVLAWRAVYYALPAILAAGFAVRGPVACRQPQSDARHLSDPTDLCSPEAGLLHQGEHRLLALSGAAWLCARTSHFLIGLFDPGRQATPQTLYALRQTARSECRMPVLYHISARTAALARKLGFAAVRVAQEAWLAPTDYQISTPPRAGLRRKLRQAQNAGITVTTPQTHSTVPWQQLDQIAHSWATRHGSERGFSMGRYARSYVATQMLYIAWHLGQPVAFATFHRGATSWALDLMRHGPDLPDGVMHLMVHTAIGDAARQGVAQLSLAAVPDFAGTRCGGRRHRFATRWTQRHAAGLAQFKCSFAPRWRPLYLAAPSTLMLPVACAAITRAVFWPKPLRAASRPGTAQDIEQDHDHYEFASRGGAWHRRQNSPAARGCHDQRCPDPSVVHP